MGKNKKMISLKDACQIISKTKNVRYDYVHDSLNCFFNLILLGLKNGYEIRIKNLGVFTPVVKDGIKKGNKKKIYLTGNFKEKENDYQRTVIEENGDVYIEFLKDSTEYICPRFTFYKTARDKMREDTIEWLD